MPPTPVPLRPTRGELAWLFGPLVGALLSVAGAYVVDGSGEVRQYAFLAGWAFFALAFLGTVRAPRRGGAPAPAAFTVTRLAGRPAFAAPPAYRVMCPRFGGLLVFPVMVWGASPALAPLAAVALVGGLLAAVRLARGVPAVALTPEGVVRGYPVRRTLGWEQVGPPELRKAGVRAVLDVRATGRRSAWARLPEVTTGVNLVYLMDAVRHYADQPEPRYAIGTDGEQERVYAELLARRPDADGHVSPQ
ncbi:hypothetical protein [Planosporangium mesophilum]|uniref:Uncharacterized protein n=1 Tax=Planosporangium mesophilum TaxID=689768 RepID=A0A8J3T7U0_9ACTN|nr:hypothetical protein [Planosporangium mesophilum]NJC81064.1 hypothetical protein [Planosporangium mesophilum]GII21293.1 hypothetical protein Pme01_08900 [Planosporangium mesophilum]